MGCERKKERSQGCFQDFALSKWKNSFHLLKLGEDCERSSLVGGILNV